MQKTRHLDLVSMYMNHAVLGGHVITLQLEESTLGHMKGNARTDPNTCSLDLWGDRRGCTKIGFHDRHVEATMMRTLDGQGHKRVHWSLHIKDVSDAKVHLIEYPSANLWYLSVETKTDGTSVVPLFDAKLFALDAVVTVQTRYGAPIRDILKRGDVAEMRAEAETVHCALAELDAEPGHSRSRSLDAHHLADVRAALKELDEALAKVKG